MFSNDNDVEYLILGVRHNVELMKQTMLAINSDWDSNEEAKTTITYIPFDVLSRGINNNVKDLDKLLI